MSLKRDQILMKHKKETQHKKLEKAKKKKGKKMEDKAKLEMNES